MIEWASKDNWCVFHFRIFGVMFNCGVRKEWREWKVYRHTGSSIGLNWTTVCLGPFCQIVWFTK